VQLSSKPKGGTSISILLTADQSDASAEFREGSAKQAKQGMGQLVLVVEDNEINLEVIRNMLEMDGHNVTVARDGKSGVAAANEHLFDAILMDISMPDMDGVEATNQIKAGDGPNAKSPIFAVTAHAMPADVDRFRTAGMVDVLVKPIGLARLNNLLSHRARPDTRHDGAMPLWDTAHQRELRETIGDDKWRALMKLFLEEMDAAANTTFAQGDVADIEHLRSQVHKLTGSAFTLGASRLGEVLRRVEEQLDVRDYNAVRDLIGLVPDCWTKTKLDVLPETRTD
jgi:CheY-like chemotaxis protein